MLGEQPELALGEEHVYSSYVPIRTPTGKMVGNYQMQVCLAVQNTPLTFKFATLPA